MTEASAPLFPVGMDGSDPVVTVLAWGVVALLRRYAPASWEPFLRRATPGLVVLAAVFLRALIAVALSEPFTLASVLRALAAGGVAVLGHSQLRALLKTELTPKPRKKKPARKSDNSTK